MALNNETQPLISIIIPIYNVEKYLDKCVNSILSQTYSNLQIILVDDGSTDQSGHICDEYLQKDPRIIVIHKKNGGLSDARNAGLERATGEYIGFVDSDDWIEPEMYELLLNAIIKDGSDISICGVSRDYTAYSIPQKNKYQILNRDEALYELFANDGMKDYAWNKLYNARLWKNVRYPMGAYYEDIYTTYKTFLKSVQVSVISENLYHYYQRDGSIARGTINPRQMEMITAVDSIMSDALVPSKYKDVLELRKLKIKYLLIWNLFVLGDKNTFEKYNSVGRNLYKDIREGRVKILRDKGISKSMKVMAILSILPYSFIGRIFAFRKFFVR